MHEKILKGRLTTPFGLYSEEIEAWDQLSSTVPDLASPFLSHHYARAVAEAGMDVRICVLYQGNAIRGFFPFRYRNRFSSWIGAAESVGGAMTDYFGLIASPRLRIASTDLLKAAQINYLSFSHLDQSQLDYGLIGEQPRIGLRIRLSQNSDPLAILLEERTKYRKDTERRARLLINDVGQMRFIFDAPHIDRKALIDQLIDEKRSQYRRTGAADALSDPWKARLLRVLASYQFSTCRSVLSCLYSGSHWIATHFGIMGNGMLQYWLPVYKPEFSKYAPGRILIHQIIQSCPQLSIHTIDRGEGDSASKRELANEEHRFFRGIWENKAVAGRLAHGVQSIKWRLGA